MNKKLSSKDPLSYSDWSNQLNYNADRSQEAYYAYLIGWYNVNSNLYPLEENKGVIKEQYIQLVKDLVYLFDEKEKDLFLSQIDYNNDEDLIYIIPYLASKLKQISQIIAQKREDLKKSKTKNQIKGSVSGIEQILYQHILKNFTKKDFQWNKIPISSLSNQFPQLSSINDNFYIEIEDLYDTGNYYDSDPTVDISEYFNVEDLLSLEPFQDLSNDQIAALVKTRFLNKISNTPISRFYNEYTSFLDSVSSSFLSSEYIRQFDISIKNQIAANAKYLSEPVYALTAVRDVDLNEPDYILKLPFENGTNWFYWPSGDKLSDFSNLRNVFRPIRINDSNLVLNRTVSGSNHLDSDLIFVEKNGDIEGAWLQGQRNQFIKDKMIVNLKSYDTTQFIFPWVGFDIDSKDLTFKQYKLNDFGSITFQKLNENLRNNILNAYYNNTLPNSACDDIYLNQTNLVNAGANAGYHSDVSDTITITPSSQSLPVWNEKSFGKVDRAFLYKFEKTDIYIKSGLSDILWPIESYESQSSNLSLRLSADTCLPFLLGTTNPCNTMAGAIAGVNFESSDVLYKLKENGGEAIEAAWLGSGSILNLDPTKNSIQIYRKPAEICAEYIDGPIQPALYQKMEAGQFTSFIWMDEDTFADDVFKFRQHSPDCPFGNSFPHNFYENSDYQNIRPINDSRAFPLKLTPCNCRAIYNSPIGSEGNDPRSYDGMVDMLFADPQGIASKFDYDTWRDTRNYDYRTSPQFAFYRLDGFYDKQVGYGTGYWLTGDKTPMVLKTGRRYTYYRTNFKVNPESSLKTPYYFINYRYKNINVICNPDSQDVVDMVILVDSSRTQFYTISDIKNIVGKICSNILNDSKVNTNVQISLVTFNSRGILLNYLTNDLDSLLGSIATIEIPKTWPEWFTNLSDGLILANRILFTTNPQDNLCNIGDVTGLCTQLTNQIINQSKISTITNCPRRNAAKKILIFSDGQETLNAGVSEKYAELIKRNNVQIISIDIGYFGLINNVMEKMASSNSYFNLQKYTLDSDFDIDKFFIDIANYTVGCFPATPIWCKAIKGTDGNWQGLNVISDMVLNAGDYLAYDHKTRFDYVAQSNSFTIPSYSFTINIKLDGWDYNTKSFSTSAIGDYFGAKPFWGKSYFPANSAFPIGGGERIVDEYVILHQPEVSNIILKNGNYITYKNYGDKFIKWEEGLNFTAFFKDQEWKKLQIKKSPSIFADELNTRNIDDFVIEATNEKSNLSLESYSSINPVKYIYYLSPRHESFTYEQGLYYIDKCDIEYVTYLSAKCIDPVEPYKNLENKFYPTVATINFPSSFINNKHVGEYLLPHKFGVSFYRGYGYSIELDKQKTSELQANKDEFLFLSPEKYGNRNRGLTKTDQPSPVKIKDINNTWFIESFSSGNMAGTVTNLVNNQKFIPYQTNYEINQKNQIGLNTQNEDYKFWQFSYYDPYLNNTNRYDFTIRNELILDNYFKEIDSLLTDIGIQSAWKTDIYGNNFGLFKGYNMETTDYILSEDDLIIIAEFGLRLETE
jgi:hypothetical protein